MSTMEQENKIEDIKPVVAFHTLGCKVNQNETEAMGALFRDAGYEIGDFEEPADVYVINTCTVTHLSDRKSRQMIRRAGKQSRDAVVVVTGCYAQTSPEEIAALEEVDLIIGTNQRSKIVEAVDQFRQDKQKRFFMPTTKEIAEFEEMPAQRLINMTRAYLKVQEGCQQFCTYCIIPYARGPLRSRALENAVAEARQLEAAGFKELILTGIHLGAYGQEQEGHPDLADLCAALLAETTIPRIRLGSVEPIEVTDKLLALMAGEPRMCRHLHIPLQSGDDDILAAMHRPYTTAEYREIVGKIRRAVPGIAVSTDLMVGFPGETDDQFRSSLIFCDEMAFSSMHIFKYSPREGTPAAAYPDQITATVKDKRGKMMAAVEEKNAKAFMSGYLEQTVQVLAEEKNDQGLWEGHTDNYLYVAFEGEAEKGELVTVLLSSLDKRQLKGKRQ